MTYSKQQQDMAWETFRRAVKNETLTEHYARLWRAAISSDSIQTKKARILQNKGVLNA